MGKMSSDAAAGQEEVIGGDSPPPRITHAEGMSLEPSQQSLFAKSWHFARSFTGGMSRMVWRSDKDFEKVLDNLSKLENLLKTRIHKRGKDWRWYARSIMLWSAALEVAFLSYAIFMTHSATLEWQRRALIVLPVFALPACAVLLYKGLAKYYRMRERQDKQALEDVQEKMKQRLDEVKDKSNFYRTLEVIQKYDNDPVVKAAAATVLGSKLGLKADLPPELQAQILPAGTPGTPDRSPTGLRSRRSSAAHPSRTTSLNPEVGGQGFTNPSPGRLSQDASWEGDAPQASYSVPAPAFEGFGSQPRGNWQPGQHESGGFVGMLERVAQMLVGEDPTQCYALICERCRQHNGLAKKEDMDVLVYHCRFCSHLNGTKDDNIAEKCRCYFCGEVRKKTGQKLEGQLTAEDRSARNEKTLQTIKDTDPDGGAANEMKGEQVSNRQTAKGRLDFNVEQAGPRRKEEGSRGAIEEGWEDLKSRTD